MSPRRTALVDLAPRSPFDGDALLAWLAARGVPGVEEVRDGAYHRVLRTPGGPVVVTLELGPDRAVARVPVGLPRTTRATVLAALRRLVDADAPLDAVATVLGADPALAPRVASDPGLRVPGTVDGAEQALRAILGQQVSVAAARTLAGRLAVRFGAPLADAAGSLTHAFPDPEALGRADPDDLGLPRARARGLVGLAAALAAGDVDLDPGGDLPAVREDLLALTGVGPWTVEYVALRTLRDLDAFPVTDLGVRNGARALGLPDTPADLLAHAERWRPWRGYAAHHLWAAASSPG